MLELTEQNAAQTLHARGWITHPQTVKVYELSGGVSNAVFLIEHGTERFIIKQARGKLRVQADWQCSIERIWREVEVLSACAKLLRATANSLICVPQLLWADRELYAYAMTAALPESRTWKERLLAGELSPSIAAASGQMLGRLHAGSWHDATSARQFDDRTYFDELRLAPYYRHAAAQVPRFAKYLDQLVEQTWRQRHALVHGDFSPKNLLTSPSQVMLIDFEVGHYGDPAFDLGFFLTHLTLKAVHLAEQRESMLQLIGEFWSAYSASLKSQVSGIELQALENRTTQHLAGCLVARVHGKSPVEYLTTTEQLRAVRLAEQLFALGPAATWEQTFQLLQQEIC